ncbi:hypothetical protein A244_14247, partial [Pseudomonas syringae pv. actinidiae ICMP 18807]
PGGVAGQPSERGEGRSRCLNTLVSCPEPGLVPGFFCHALRGALRVQTFAHREQAEIRCGFYFTPCST